MRRKIPILACALLLTAFTSSLNGQFRLFGPKPTPQPMRKASDLIRRQAPVKVNQSLLKHATQDNTRIVVSIPQHRPYLMIAHEIVADGPMPSGKLAHGLPTA